MKLHIALSLSVLASMGTLAPVSAYDINYKGPYEVIASRLNCRSGPGLNFRVRTSIQQGKQILAQRVVYDQKQSPWLLTDRNCFVRGDSAYLKYSGPGEDPSTMCDPRTEPC
ncbi:MAG: hypothetical protein ACFCU8_17730 [Thermosynechococcaceae cyanobacterium]